MQNAEIVIVLQIVFIFVILVANLLFVFLPLKVVPKDHASLSNKKSHRIIGFCSSLSAGVFLGTCYVQLIPYVETRFSEVFEKAGLDPDYANLTAQCTIMAGFLLIVVIEQAVHGAQHRRKESGSQGHDHVKLQQFGHVPEIAEAGYDASSDSSGSLDSDSDDDPRRTMLKKPKANNSHQPAESTAAEAAKLGFTPPAPKEGGQGHWSEGHGESHGALVGGHGHSHIIDVAQHHSGLRCILLLVALSCHSLFEGMAVGLQNTVANLVNLFIGVFVHECLVAFAIGISLAQQRLNRSLVIKLGIVFSLMIPVGMVMGLGIGEIHGVKAEFSAIVIQAIAAGTFVYVIFLEVLPLEINAQGDKVLRLLFLFLGFFIILCLRLALKDS